MGNSGVKNKINFVRLLTPEFFPTMSLDIFMLYRLNFTPKNHYYNSA